MFEYINNVLLYSYKLPFALTLHVIPLTLINYRLLDLIVHESMRLHGPDFSPQMD